MKQFYQLLGGKSGEKKKETLDEKTVFFLFEKALTLQYGVKGKENVFPDAFKEGVLFISVHKSLWQTELSLEKGFFIQAVNKQVGEEVILDIQVKRK